MCLTYVSSAHSQLSFFGISSSLYSNMVQGLGNLSIGVNLSFVPAYWFDFYEPSDGFYNPTPSYLFFATVLFLSVKIIGWNHGFSKHVSYGAAWFLSFIAFPFFLNSRLYWVTN